MLAHRGGLAVVSFQGTRHLGRRVGVLGVCGEWSVWQSEGVATFVHHRLGRLFA